MSTIQVAGYQLTQHLHTNEQVSVFRAIRSSDYTRVMLLKPGEDRARHRNIKEEFVLLSSLSSNFVAGACDLVEDGHTCLVLDDVMGISLAHSLELRAFSAMQLQQIAVRFINALDDLHAQGILFSNFSCDSIFYHRESQSLTLLDFSLACSINSLPDRNFQPKVWESPELTGLTGRVLDERSDYHGMGVVLYKLATGHYPFEQGKDFARALLTRSPPSVRSLRSDLPDDLAGLIDRLVQPEPEDRCQSVLEIRQLIDPDYNINDYDAGVPPFHLSQKHYGREDILENLLSNLSGQRAHHYLLVGPSGIGKTALANQVCKFARLNDVTVLTAKFEESHQDTPYHGLGVLFASLAVELDNDLKLASRLALHLDDSAGILARAFQPLQRFFKVSDPQDGDVSTIENNLLIPAIVRLLTGMNENSRRLLLFVDDLQWMDEASSSVFTALLTANIAGLNILGGWRVDDFETQTGALSLDDLRRDFSALRTIKLNPFDEKLVLKILQDSLGRNADIDPAIVDVFLRKTQGYPHFVGQMLQESVRDGAVVYAESRNCWITMADMLAQYPATNNVGEILARQIAGYDEEFKQSLKLAACFGQRISRQMFVDLTTQDRIGVKHFIDRAAADGLLNSQRNLLSFAHDKVHSVVYRTLTDNERKANHERIAALFALYASRDGIDRTFEIANQYHQYPGLADTPLEFRKRVANIFLKSGSLAINNFAFGSALEYLSKGIELLSDQSWHNEPALKSDLFLNASDAAYMSGDLHRASTLLGVLISNSPDNLSRANACRIQMKVFVAQNNMDKAIEFGHQGLKEIGFATPRQVSKVRAYVTLRWLKFNLRNLTADISQQRKPMKSPVSHAAVLLYANLISAASRAGDPTIAVYVSRMLREALKNGDMDEAGSTLCFFAVSVKTFFRDVDEAYRLGKIASQMTRNPAYFLTNTTLLDGLINCWKEPMRATGERLISAYRRGVKTEDVEVAITAAMYGASRLFYTGTSLNESQKLFKEIAVDAARLNQSSQIRIEGVYEQCITNLQTKVDEPWLLDGRHFSEDQVQKLTPNGRAHYFILSAYIALLFDNCDAARDYITATGPNLPAVGGEPLTHNYYFIECMIHARAGESPRLTQQLKKLKYAAGHAPMNFAHQVDLIEAELAWATGRHDAAEQLFRTARESAEANDMNNDAGLICERAMRFFMQTGDDAQAQTMQRRAKTAYSRWGLESKLHALL